MYYDCDLDVIKTSFPAHSEHKLFQDIAKEVASIWDNNDLFDTADISLKQASEKNEFVFIDKVAICSVKLAGLDRPAHMVYKLSEPMKFQDNTHTTNVNLVFAMLSPEDDGGLHLRRLSRLSRLLQEKDFQDKLMQSTDKQSVRALFMYPEMYVKAA